MGKKIDYGCGNEPKKGYIGLNFPITEEADIEHDITDFPHPFDDNSVEAIYCDNVLEHFYLDEIHDILEEWARVCEDEALIEIRVPHYLNKNAHTLNHKTKFSEVFWNCITPSHEYPVKDLEQSFEIVEIDRIWRGQKVVSLMRLFLPDEWVHTFVANTVDELKFKLKVIK